MAVQDIRSPPLYHVGAPKADRDCRHIASAMTEVAASPEVQPFKVLVQLQPDGGLT
eukprot:CAMPEP_0185560802 /NCGR_PEP_ID=MMETSP1381-20130426/57748_1 /TAXON_ID=298111 /ORGANISM="Pavlova sp., Strain CCMP459" /LENGTH=55 /DNA_ID=CAMNT_0028174537 /DNA_START=19 /DNA_END=183 /DNA_ORIENTATION=-